MEPISLFAPAKLNLFLAVTGRRADGFHNLVSLVVRLEFGDVLRAEPAERTSLYCDDPAVPADESNLVLKAAAAFHRATQWHAGVKFTLQKRIPMGAGLGGGSSDAAAALRALNRLIGPERALPEQRLAALAAEVGSDCPLFLADGPVIMRGRGERVERLPAEAVRRLQGRRVLVCKPGFGISTPWAYEQLVAVAPEGYVAAAEAEARLATWLGDATAPAEALGFNNMEPPAFAKYLALPVLRTQVRRDFGLDLRMSGSGSACFALLPENADAAPLMAAIQAAWGRSALVVETRIV